MHVAVVGHVEAVELLRVGRVPGPGQVADAVSLGAEAGGAGGIPARQLAKLGCELTFFAALGDGAAGRQAVRDLEADGVRVEAVFRPGPQRSAVVLVDDDAERSIVTVGEKHVPGGADPLPWSELKGADGSSS